MKAVVLSILTICAHWHTYGQSQETLEKIESARIGLITERLNLTPEQAEKFWPIYKEFQGRQRDIRSEFRERRKGFDPKTASEEENKKLLELGMKVKERQLNLEREYQNRLLRIISNRQLLSLRRAEDDFKQMLIKRVRQREAQRQCLQESRERNKSTLDKRRNN
ncbi:MAG: hypothetical protein KI790_14960 [Cyclobacteriaceae bacterium]|nr:hypothetical protein [Cyclobacteriaceae bacterium HetDA_MAG_MS6]